MERGEAKTENGASKEEKGRKLLANSLRLTFSQLPLTRAINRPSQFIIHRL